LTITGLINVVIFQLQKLYDDFLVHGIVVYNKHLWARTYTHLDIETCALRNEQCNYFWL